MGWTMVLVVAGAVLLVGFLVGVRFEEANLRRRERQLAAERRALRQRAEALHRYEELDRMLVAVLPRAAPELSLTEPPRGL